jgi:hypothetical protein
MAEPTRALIAARPRLLVLVHQIARVRLSPVVSGRDANEIDKRSF